MIDHILRWLAARFWRRKIEAAPNWVTEWQRENPGRCMYCSYTAWANREHGQNLKMEPHGCVEGRGGPTSFPQAVIWN